MRNGKRRRSAQGAPGRLVVASRARYFPPKGARRAMISTVIGGAMPPQAPQFFTMPETENKAVVAHAQLRTTSLLLSFSLLLGACGHNNPSTDPESSVNVYPANYK